MLDDAMLKFVTPHDPATELLARHGDWLRNFRQQIAKAQPATSNPVLVQMDGDFVWLRKPAWS